MGHDRGGVVGLVTLGCDKNTVDMEYIAGALEAVGLRWRALNPVDDAAGDDLAAVVILTCGFVGDAKRQSVEALVHWAEQKKQSGGALVLAAAGCLSQRYANELVAEMPELDVVTGVGDPDGLAGRLKNLLRSRDGKAPEAVSPSGRPDLCWNGGARRRAPLGRSSSAFLKISDGCDHDCAFCAIPMMKGPHRSVPRDVLLAEARALLRRGARELVLVAQDSTAYGRDLYDDYGLAELLADLDALPGDFWIRILYAYPTGIRPRLLDAMASLRHVVPYLDMPLQHLDPDVLRRMRRPVRAADPFVVTEKLRRAVPGITLRTTFILGHPGETRQAFTRLMKSVESIRFNWAGAFAWSPEEGTDSASHEDRPDPRTVRRRLERFMTRQAEITAAWNAERVGGVEEVLIESVDPESGMAIGRTVREAPEVDGSVYLRRAGDYVPGHVVPARIVNASVFDLEAEPL
ncbi:MAG TPA: 30S ribosomal protein S12 methylthiotransferase RimO [Candidatus Hydrogenedentes bacterium]|nr:30S ribosomal protein S12 methylthiotransferase RimO [Candidatus Hydrogenedentota bacterium]